jgi:hypothetical protein
VDELEILDPQGEQVVIGGKTFTIKPLVFRDYRKMVKHLADAVDIVAGSIPDFDLSDSAGVGKIAAALFQAGDPVLKMLAEILGTTPEFLDENMTMEDFSKVLLSVVRQNNLDRIIANFTALAPLLKKNA